MPCKRKDFSKRFEVSNQFDFTLGLIWTCSYSENFFQCKNKLIKEIYNLKQFIHKNNICFECEIESLSTANFLLETMSKLNAQNKYWSHNRDKSKYLPSTFNLKRLPGHHLPTVYLQLTIIFVYAYVDCRYTLTGYLTFSAHLYKMNSSFLKVIQTFYFFKKIKTYSINVSFT